MKFTYNSESMTLYFKIGKYSKYLQCPFATWWKARKYFRKPKFTFYFGPMWEYKGRVRTKFGKYDDYEYKGGYWPFVSTEYLKSHSLKWFPIHIVSWDICWKDKYNSPRYERPGCFIIFFGKDYRKHWQLSILVSSPEVWQRNNCNNIAYDDFYWESILWYLYYYKEYQCEHKDLISARNTLQNCWSSFDSININDISILDIRKDKLFDEYYTVIKVKSNYLKENTSTFPEFSETDISVRNNGKTFKCRYIKSKFDPNFKDNTVELWCDQLELTGDIEVIKYINVDLGPTFKDEFLNKCGIKLIKQWYKQKQ